MWGQRWESTEKPLSECAFNVIFNSKPLPPSLDLTAQRGSPTLQPFPNFLLLSWRIPVSRAGTVKTIFF